jgi:beta-glucosidase
MYAVGIVEHPPFASAIDYKSDAAEALEIARRGIVLLKNEGRALPLATSLKRIAVIGGQAHVGVLSGGGSSQVTPSNGPPVIVPVGGRGMMMVFRNEYFFPSAPLKTIQAASPATQVFYDAGNFPDDAAALAAGADVAVVFVTRHELEGYDIPNLRLPNGQDQLIEAVAAANPHTIVVLETGNPVTMPWLDKVSAVLAAWYPGQEGGQAIADILFGAINPSGHLPITFPVDEAHTMRPKLPNQGLEPDVEASVDYVEGADVGYRWFVRRGVKSLFPFGHGLSYSSFGYTGFDVKSAKPLSVTFTVRNTAGPRGTAVPQVYLVSINGRSEPRLLGFRTVVLDTGEEQTVRIDVDRRLLSHFDEKEDRWQLAPGVYRLAIGRSAEDLVQSKNVILSSATFK